MPSKFQLLPKDIDERLKDLPGRLAQVPGLAGLWLFGSFARGAATPISDVDLAYLPDDALHGEALEDFETKLYVAISGALRTDEFTFMDLRRAPVFFGGQALAEGKMLVCQDARAVAQTAEAIYGLAPDVRCLRQAGNADFLEAFGMPSPEIDKDRVAGFLRLISDDLLTLREEGRVAKSVYVGSRKTQAIVERRLQTAIESAINIGNHLIARLGLRAPADYADVFDILGEARVLSRELAGQMMDMAKFRNLLVHVYWRIDHERVYDGLQARIALLEAFANHIAQWLRKHEQQRNRPIEGNG